MKIIPAIDIYKDKFVRLKKGKFKQKIKIRRKLLIKKILKLKCKRIHIVDLEGAKKGKIKNNKRIFKTIKILRKKSKRKIKIQVGGGIRTIKQIRKFIKKELEIILGTKIIEKNIKIPKLFKKFIKNVILSVDYKKNYIYLKGWKKKKKKLSSYIKNINKSKLKKIIFTDIERDGTKKGINIKNIKNICKKICKKKKIIIAGGIKNKKEIKKVNKKIKYKNLYGIIGGKFLF